MNRTPATSREDATAQQETHLWVTADYEETFMTKEMDVEKTDSETLARIRERTLREEKKQLHMQKVHNLIPKLKEIVEEEIPE